MTTAVSAPGVGEVARFPAQGTLRDAGVVGGGLP